MGPISTCVPPPPASERLARLANRSRWSRGPTRPRVQGVYGITMEHDAGMSGSVTINNVRINRIVRQIVQPTAVRRSQTVDGLLTHTQEGLS
jgi:hypothetical protein